MRYLLYRIRTEIRYRRYLRASRAAVQPGALNGLAARILDD